MATVKPFGRPSALHWRVTAPPGQTELLGTLIDNVSVCRVLPDGQDASLVITAEIPSGAIAVVDISDGLSTKNRCGLSRLVFSLSYCDKPFNLATIRSIGTSNEI